MKYVCRLFVQLHFTSSKLIVPLGVEMKSEKKMMIRLTKTGREQEMEGTKRKFHNVVGSSLFLPVHKWCILETVFELADY